MTSALVEPGQADQAARVRPGGPTALLRAERVRAGQAAARERGKHLGRRPGIRTRLKVTPEQETLVKRLKAEGRGVSAIARATGLSRPTVYSVLRA
jgi:DNA invertase Pin-like site-specific DNA recombinase